jgi:hypothetical protein
MYNFIKPENFYDEPFPFSFEKTLANRIAPNAKAAKLRRTRRKYGTSNL